jgi:hypothetical protein
MFHIDDNMERNSGQVIPVYYGIWRIKGGK